MKTVLRSLALALPLLAAAQTVDVKSLQPQGYVSDFAGVIDASARQDLERYCALVERGTGAQLALVTISSIGDEPIEDFSNALFRQWGIGAKGKDEGLLLLLVIGDKQSRLEVGRGLEPYITDGTSGALLREMRPALGAGRYAEAMGTAAHALGQRIAAVKGVAIEETYRPRRRVRESERTTQIPWPMLLGGVFILFWLLGSLGGGRRGGGGGGGGLLAGMILGSVLNRSSHGGYGGGGFGGYDSGDSFGGFGGGDSGGGGASSDW
jgi:uncharacterized protein